LPLTWSRQWKRPSTELYVQSLFRFALTDGRCAATKSIDTPAFWFARLQPMVVDTPFSMFTSAVVASADTCAAIAELSALEMSLLERSGDVLSLPHAAMAIAIAPVPTVRRMRF